MKCLECQKELIQTAGKRVKRFCNSTCRSNYWQKAKRKVAENNKPANKKKIEEQRNPTETKKVAHEKPLTFEEMMAVAEANLKSKK